MRPAPVLWALTSALLILAVILLRAVFGKRVGAGVRYALWGVVLLRLLAPVQLFTVPVPAAVRQTEPSRPMAADPLPSSAPILPADAASPSEETVVNTGTIPAPERPEAFALNVGEVLGWAWLCGSAVTAAALLASNLSFARRLRRVRRPLCSFSREKKNQKELQTRFQRGDRPQLAPDDETDCLRGYEGPLPVYVTEALPSPCLFGLFRPAIYITPSAAADPAVLRHVLAHEYTHFRHGDHIWNVLRGAALAVHWWNPLVWLAAALSRRDCELACDEGTLKRLGEGERFAYGRTLLTLVTAQTRPAGLLSCATTMTGNGRTVARRVKRIARAPKRWLWAAIAAVLLAALAAACAFGQGEEADPDPQLPWAEGADSLRYVRDKGGLSDEFAIRLHRDGSFAYFEGGFSSFIGMGTWTQEGDVIRLADERNEAHLMYHYFTLEEDALIFQAGESDRFLYVDVADGDRFSLDTDPPERDWFDDHGDNPTPAPEQAVPLNPGFSVNGEAAGVDITGLDCESARWSTETPLGWTGPRNYDPSHLTPPPGYLSIREPRFLGGPFAVNGAELRASCYHSNFPEDGPLLFLEFDQLGSIPGFPIASVYAFVDLTAGTVQEKGISGVEEGAELFSDELLVRTAQRLALLIEDAAGYYDEAAEMQQKLKAEQAELERAAREAAAMQTGGQGWVEDKEQFDAFQKKLEAEQKAAEMQKQLQAERAIFDGSLSLFQITFPKLSEAEQEKQLDKVYADRQSAFWGAAVGELDGNSALIQRFAEKTYVDGSISYFSVLAGRMSEEELRTWLDRALADGKWDFQTMLFSKLDMDEEKGAKEEEWARQQMGEYQAVGVTMDGKNYYYQGQLVNIFLDIRANGSFYTLDTNPAGTVNVRILRDENNRITGAAYMTEAEAAELLADMNDPDDG